MFAVNFPHNLIQNYYQILTSDKTSKNTNAFLRMFMKYFCSVCSLFLMRYIDQAPLTNLDAGLIGHTTWLSHRVNRCLQLLIGTWCLFLTFVMQVELRRFKHHDIFSVRILDVKSINDYSWLPNNYLSEI